jgi:hypothetical protein
MSLALLASSADAQERRWIANKTPEGIEVMYGMPESDDILFAIRCEAETKEVFVGFAHKPVSVEPGGPITLVLFSEAGEVELPAIVTYLDTMDITLIETPDVPGALLRPVFTEGTTLSIMVEDGVEEIPLTDTVDDFDALFTACGT